MAKEESKIEEKNEKVSHGLKYYAREKKKMLAASKDEVAMFLDMDAMWQNKIELPAELLEIEGFHQVTPTEPSDSIQAARRLLATVEPKPTFYPLDSTPETRERANTIEKTLSWHYKQADTRSDGDMTGDIVFNALLYDKCDVFVEYLPWQNKLSGVEADPNWDDSGAFSFIVYHPGDVKTIRTSRGLQVVMVCTKLTPEEVIERWGDKAKTIIEDYANEKGRDAEYPDFVTYCDWWDKEDRVVWLEFSDGGDDEIEDNRVIIAAPHELPFIPFACRRGGKQLRPLLTGIQQAKSWVTTAIMESLLVTEAIKTGAAPLTFSNTNDGKSPNIDYTIIGGNVALKLNEHITPMVKPTIDHRLTELTDRLQTRMGSSTLPRMLRDPSFAGRQAFATFNAELRQSANVLDPAKKLSERILSDAYIIMLRWIIHSKEPLYAYDFADGKSETYGKQLAIDPQTIPPKDIYLEIELQTKLPLDKVSEMNAASLLVDKFGMSREEALEEINFIDAQSVMERGQQEQLSNAEFQNALVLIQAKGQAAAKEITDAQALQTQQKQMEMQQQAQQTQQMQQQQAAQPQQQDPMAQQQQQGQPQNPGDLAMAQQQSTARAAANMDPNDAAAELGRLTGGMQGMAHDPSRGGQSPTSALPGMLTKESMTKRTRGGSPT